MAIPHRRPEHYLHGCKRVSRHPLRPRSNPPNPSTGAADSEGWGVACCLVRSVAVSCSAVGRGCRDCSQGSPEAARAYSAHAVSLAWRRGGSRLLSSPRARAKYTTGKEVNLTSAAYPLVDSALQVLPARRCAPFTLPSSDTQASDISYLSGGKLERSAEECDCNFMGRGRGRSPSVRRAPAATKARRAW